jgi:hypothetical protein
MFARIQNLAKELGLSEGSLLKLARDIAHDGALVSVRHLRKADQEALLAFLEKVTYADKARELTAV